MSFVQNHDCNVGWIPLLHELDQRFNEVVRLSGMPIVSRYAKQKHGKLKLIYQINNLTQTENEPNYRAWKHIIDTIVSYYCLKASEQCEHLPNTVGKLCSIEGMLTVASEDAFIDLIRTHYEWSEHELLLARAWYRLGVTSTTQITKFITDNILPPTLSPTKT